MIFSPFMLLCGTGLFAIFSSTISKSPVLPLFAKHLGADPSGVGLVASVSAFTGVVASIPAGILSDRFGRKRMLLFSLMVFSTAPFLYLWVESLWQLALVRFYHGLATAIFVPVAMALVSDVYEESRGEKLGWFSTSTLMGRFVAPVVGGGIIGALLYNPAMSYKVVYLVCGGAALVALVLSLKVSEPRQNNRAQESWAETFKAFKGVIVHKGILITSGVEAAILFAYGTFETFLPLYCLSVGLSPYEIGIFLSSQVLTLALSKPMMGRFSDRHGRPPQIFVGALLGAVCIGSFHLFTTFVPILILSIFFGLSLSVVTSATSAYIGDLSQQQSRGSAMGVLGSVMDIGHTTGPIVAGVAASYFGYAWAFVVAGMVLIVLGIIFWIIIQGLRAS